MSDLSQGERRVGLLEGERRVWLGLILVALGWALVVSLLQFARLDQFQPRSFDLAIYAQLLWNAGHGDPTSSIQQVSALGVHATPLLFALAPLTWLFDPSRVLVVAQALALAAQAPLLYLILRRYDPVAASRAALLLLLYPPLWTVAMADVHPVTFGLPWMLLLFWALDRERLPVALALALGLGLLVHEVYPLVLVGLALAALVGRRWKQSAWLGAMGLACFVLVSGLLLPSLRGEALQLERLYGHLGDGPLQVVLSPVLRPGAFFSHVARVAGSAWLPGLLLPLAALPLLRPTWLLPALPILALHGLSLRLTQQDLSFHYHAPLIPCLLLACGAVLCRVGGGGRLERRLPPRLAWGLLAVCLLSSWFVFEPPRQIWREALQEHDPRAAVVAQLVAQVPAGEPAAGSVELLAPLALRARLWGLPGVVRGFKDWSTVPYAPPPPEAWILADTADSTTFWDPHGLSSPGRDAIVAEGSRRWRRAALAPGRGVHAVVEGVVLLGPGASRALLHLEPPEPSDLPNTILSLEPADSPLNGVTSYRLTLSAPQPGALLVLDYFDAHGKLVRQRAWPLGFHLLPGWEEPVGRVVVPLGLLRGVGARARLRLWPPGAERGVDPLEIELTGS